MRSQAWNGPPPAAHGRRSRARLPVSTPARRAAAPPRRRRGGTAMASGGRCRASKTEHRQVRRDRRAGWACLPTRWSRDACSSSEASSSRRARPAANPAACRHGQAGRCSSRSRRVGQPPRPGRRAVERDQRLDRQPQPATGAGVGRNAPAQTLLRRGEKGTPSTASGNRPAVASALKRLAGIPDGTGYRAATIPFSCEIE